MSGWWVLIIAFFIFIVAVIGGKVADFWHSAFFPGLLIYIVLGLIFPPVGIVVGALVLFWLFLSGGGQGFFNWINSLVGGK